MPSPVPCSNKYTVQEGKEKMEGGSRREGEGGEESLRLRKNGETDERRRR